MKFISVSTACTRVRLSKFSLICAKQAHRQGVGDSDTLGQRWYRKGMGSACVIVRVMGTSYNQTSDARTVGYSAGVWECARDKEHTQQTRLQKRDGGRVQPHIPRVGTVRRTHFPAVRKPQGHLAILYRNMRGDKAHGQSTWSLEGSVGTRVPHLGCHEGAEVGQQLLHAWVRPNAHAVLLQQAHVLGSNGGG